MNLPVGQGLIEMTETLIKKTPIEGVTPNVGDYLNYYQSFRWEIHSIFNNS